MRGVEGVLTPTYLIPLGRRFSGGVYVYDCRIVAGIYFGMTYVGAVKVGGAYVWNDLAVCGWQIDSLFGLIFLVICCASIGGVFSRDQRYRLPGEVLLKSGDELIRRKGTVCKLQSAFATRMQNIP